MPGGGYSPTHVRQFAVSFGQTGADHLIELTGAGPDGLLHGGQARLVTGDNLGSDWEIRVQHKYVKGTVLL